jgi:hypothetical protein
MNDQAMTQMSSFNQETMKLAVNSAESRSAVIHPTSPLKGIISMIIMALLFFAWTESRAETYYSQGDLPANLTASWNTGTSGGGSSPTGFEGVHTWIISYGNSMTLSDSWTVGTGGPATVVIEGSLTLSSDYLLAVTGTLAVNGAIVNRGSYLAGSAVTATGGITVSGQYEHAIDGGYLPSATWASGSTCLVSGWLGSSSLDNASFDQQFFNFTWNCHNQSSNVSFNGHVASVTGTFSLIQSGINSEDNNTPFVITPFGDPTYGSYFQSGGYYKLSDGVEISRSLIVLNDFSITGGEFQQDYTAPGALTVGGNYSCSGGRHRISWDDENSASTATVEGDFSLSGDGIVVITAYCHVGGVLNINGNLTITGGWMHMSFDDLGGAGLVNLNGNLSHTGGYIDAEPGGSGTIVFGGSVPQTYVTGGSLAGNINYAVNSGSALTVNGDLPATGIMTVNSDATTSGSVIVSGESTGNITYNRQLNPVYYHYFSSPVVSGTFPTAATVWEYNEVTGAWDIITECESGRGYTLQTGISSLSFSGTMPAADIVIGASSPYSDIITGVETNYDSRTFASGRDLDHYGGGGWNLLGNPYPSALRVSDFIEANYSSIPANSNFDPNYVALYLYDGIAFHYVANSTGWPGGSELNEDYIQTGQGFFVLAMNDNSEFTFSRSMQGHDTDVPLLKSAEQGDRWPGLQLKVGSNDMVNLTTVVFDDEMTTGLDPGFDVGLYSSGPGVGIYTTLVDDNGVNFARQALPINGFHKNIVPVGIDFAKGGEVVFSADVEPLRNFRFILEDRATNIFTDLNSDSYTVNLPPKTYGTGRFFIHVSSGRSLRQKSGDRTLSDLRIWASDNNRVNIQGAVSDNAVCQIYDSRGNKIFETRLSDTFLNTVTITSVIRGVYLVRVIDGVKVHSGKVLFP